MTDGRTLSTQPVGLPPVLDSGGVLCEIDNGDGGHPAVDRPAYLRKGMFVDMQSMEG